MPKKHIYVIAPDEINRKKLDTLARTRGDLVLHEVSHHDRVSVASEFSFAGRLGGWDRAVPRTWI